MASFRQRSGKWQARIIRDGYPDQTKTFETKADAEKWARSVESEIDKGQFVNVNEAQRTTLGDVIGRYLAEVTPSSLGVAFRMIALTQNAIRFSWPERSPSLHETQCDSMPLVHLVLIQFG